MTWCGLEILAGSEPLSLFSARVRYQNRALSKTYLEPIRVERKAQFYLRDKRFITACTVLLYPCGSMTLSSTRLWS